MTAPQPDVDKSVALPCNPPATGHFSGSTGAFLRSVIPLFSTANGLRQMLVLLALTFPLCHSGVRAQLPAVRLGAIFPAGALPGTTLDVTISGSDLDDVTQLLCNHPGITFARKMAEPTPFDEGPQPVERVFTVQVASDVPIGNYEIRCQGRYGVSNRRLFAVGTTPEFTETEPNGGNDVPVWTEADGVRSNAAQEVTVPVFINGQSLGGPDVDWFRLQAKAGQRLLLTAFCRHIDSRMTPVVTVYREDGIVMAESRVGPGGEATAELTPATDGLLFIKVHDSIFSQGEEYTYRLLIASTPRADFIFPPHPAPTSSFLQPVCPEPLPSTPSTGATCPAVSPLRLFPTEPPSSN